jgi:hypothetical protein
MLKRVALFGFFTALTVVSLPNVAEAEWDGCYRRPCYPRYYDTRYYDQRYYYQPRYYPRCCCGGGYRGYESYRRYEYYGGDRWYDGDRW